MSDLLKVSGLSVGYPKQLVVSGLSFTAGPGQFISLMGPNGSGKSTILKTLAGLQEAIEGDIFVKGQKIQDHQPKELAKIMALVSTERVNPSQMTGREIVALGRSPYLGLLAKQTDQDKEVVDKAISLVKGQAIADQNYNQLSDGQKQKIMIARALAQEPEIILLDEPTSYLDVKHKIEVLNILKNLCQSQGICVVVALHDIDLALKVSDEVILINDGLIQAQGIPEEVARGGKIDQLYNIASAHFSDRVHNLELVGPSLEKAFVVGGGSTAGPVYRLLNRLGIGFVTGVLAQHDIDYQIAKTTASKVISTPPYQIISSVDIDRAVGELDKVACVIDTGFPLGPVNQLNLDIIKKAQMKNIPIYSLRPDNNYNTPTINSMTELEIILKENLL